MTRNIWEQILQQERERKKDYKKIKQMRFIVLTDLEFISMKKSRVSFSCCNPTRVTIFHDGFKSRFDKPTTPYICVYICTRTSRECARGTFCITLH